MASVFTDLNSVLPRSQSSTSLPDFLSYEFKGIHTAVTADGLPRSASYTSLPIIENPAYNVDGDSAQDFPTSLRPGSSGGAESIGRVAVERGIFNNDVAQDERPRVGRTKTVVRKKSWIQRAIGHSPERQESAEHKPSRDTPSLSVDKDSLEKSNKVPGSFATYARRSWISSSRSPSPSRRKWKKDGSENTANEDEAMKSGSMRPSSARKGPSQPGESTTEIAGFFKRQISKNPLQKRATISHIGMLTVEDLHSANTSNSSLTGSLSEKASTASGSTELTLPRSGAKEKLPSFDFETPRKDELWSTFRTLESDHQKFQAKGTNMRTNVVRSSLLPFLQNYAHHPSNKNLRPEDIDRRVSILSKWWIGLLEMLDGHHNQHISGVDRPVILEAITGIMTRSEWRLAPSYFAPVADRSVNHSLLRSRSSGSLNSSSSQFLAESVYHKVRTMFIQNLLNQMRVVVDKMSSRSTPASLVTFCGKAAAYAFFFCPGVAGNLVRAWSIPPEAIRRVVNEFGLTRQSPGNSVDEIVTNFPPNLHSLGWKSSKAMTSLIRPPLSIPIGAPKIPWQGPWTARWCGRDSDLFFVFCKHYHILCEEFLPLDALLVDKARAPGFILVHAQILTALDATIHRLSPNDTTVTALSLAFDDMISGAEPSAAALPLPPSSNITRLMTENRLILLLRDFMSEQSPDFSTARRTFAEAFASALSAAARKTSIFNHNACFILCDFIEEALTIYLRFQKSFDVYVDYIDWAFWLNVCQKMLQSENTMTEIRLFSFLFKSWNMIVEDERRRKVLCFDWLMTEDIFRKYFLHWCPMVRAYYMRLLCWRACRFVEDTSELDIKIYGRVSDLLKSVWSYYLYQKQNAERGHQIHPSIEPCQPAPGRRLLIIRSDNPVPMASLFLGFDGIVQSYGSQEPAHRRYLSLAGPVRSEATGFNMPTEPSANSRRSWSILSRIVPFNTTDVTEHEPGSSRTSQRTVSPLEQARQAAAAARARPPSVAIPRPSSSLFLPDSTLTTPVHKPFSFKFSLEWTQAPYQSHLHKKSDSRNGDSRSNSASVDTPTGRRLSPPRLPDPAHAYLVGKVPGTMTEVAPNRLTSTEAKYAGRALAEWALVVIECNNFVERRKAEGVPGLKMTEVPTLGVEGFRRYSHLSY